MTLFDDGHGDEHICEPCSHSYGDEYVEELKKMQEPKPPTKPQIIGKLAELLAEIDELTEKRRQIDPHEGNRGDGRNPTGAQQIRENHEQIELRKMAISAIKWVLTGEELKFE